MDSSFSLPTEQQLRRMQGIIAMLQHDKSELAVRGDSLEAQLGLARSASAKLAQQAEERDALGAELQVRLATPRECTLPDVA